MTSYPWVYVCSICHEEFAPDEVTKHLEEEKAKPDWPGVLTWTRKDLLDA